MNARSAPIRPTLILLCLAALTGCSTARRPDYQPETASRTAQTIQQDGLVVTLDPFVEKERTQRYFGIHALNEGIAILHVRVENQASDRAVLVTRSSFELVPAGASSGVAAVEDKVRRSTAGGEAVMWTGASIGSVPMLFAGASLLSQSAEVKRNLVSKELREQTLPPGDTVEGFIYYTPIPKRTDWSRGASVRVRLPEPRSGHVTAFSAALSN